jgi:hypothetical protein
MVVNPNPTINVIKIDHVDILVVDDFLLNPIALRDLAIESYEDVLNQEPISVKSTNNTGSNFFEKKTYPWGRYNESNPHYKIYINRDRFREKFPGLIRRIKYLISKHISPNAKKYFDTPETFKHLALSHGPYFNAVHEQLSFSPHVDLSHVSTFLYLNLPEQTMGGTAIYRHIPTNALTINQNTPSLEPLCKIPLTEPLLSSTEEWCLEEMVEMKFNRLVVFNARTIHKIHWTDECKYFEKDIHKTRLALNNFFEYCN